MAATTTPSINSLVDTLKSTFPHIKFEESLICAWQPATKTILYSDDPFQLLHEVGHALCDHSKYTRDIELIGHERDAWTAALDLAKELQIIIPNDVVQSHMDTYRDWLHARSTCISCDQPGGIETAQQNYTCLSCRTKWRVNDARNCQLRRVAA